MMTIIYIIMMMIMRNTRDDDVDDDHDDMMNRDNNERFMWLTRCEGVADTVCPNVWDLQLATILSLAQKIWSWIPDHRVTLVTIGYSDLAPMLRQGREIGFLPMKVAMQQARGPKTESFLPCSEPL